MTSGWLKIPKNLNERGAVAVEYAFTMVISAAILYGAYDLFRALAVDILLSFIDVVARPWP
jgi:hypothetical protein